MIVIETGKFGNGDTFTRFSHVECDVEDCGKEAPKDACLTSVGWYIAPGKHRCPEHFATDVPGRSPDRRTADKITKKI